MRRPSPYVSLAGLDVLIRHAEQPSSRIPTDEHGNLSGLGVGWRLEGIDLPHLAQLGGCFAEHPDRELAILQLIVIEHHRSAMQGIQDGSIRLVPGDDRVQRPVINDDRKLRTRDLTQTGVGLLGGWARTGIGHLCREDVTTRPPPAPRLLDEFLSDMINWPHSGLNHCDLLGAHHLGNGATGSNRRLQHGNVPGQPGCVVIHVQPIDEPTNGQHGADQRHDSH